MSALAGLWTSSSLWAIPHILSLKMPARWFFGKILGHQLILLRSPWPRNDQSCHAPKPWSQMRHIHLVRSLLYQAAESAIWLDLPMPSIMLSWSGNVGYHFELSPLVLATCKFDPSSSICDELEVELLDDANVEDDESVCWMSLL